MTAITPDLEADAPVEQHQQDEGDDVDGDSEEGDVQGACPAGREVSPAVVDSRPCFDLTQSANRHGVHQGVIEAQWCSVGGSRAPHFCTMTTTTATKGTATRFMWSCPRAGRSENCFLHICFSISWFHKWIQRGIPGGPGPPCPQDFFKIRFQANLRKPPYFQQMLVSGPPWGQNSSGPP